MCCLIVSLLTSPFQPGSALGRGSRRQSRTRYKDEPSRCSPRRREAWDRKAHEPAGNVQALATPRGEEIASRRTRYQYENPQRAALVLRHQGERGFALMSQRWRAIQHVSLSPITIGDIAKAAGTSSWLCPMS